MSPWKALEGTVARLIGTVTYYTFRMGENLLFTGPFGSPSEASSPLTCGPPARRATSPIPSGGGSLAGGESPSGDGFSSETPISRAKAVVRAVARGWNGASSWSKDNDRIRSGGDQALYGSGTTTAASESSSATSRRWGDSGVEGSRLERAVSEALDR